MLNVRVDCPNCTNHLYNELVIFRPTWAYLEHESWWDPDRGGYYKILVMCYGCDSEVSLEDLGVPQRIAIPTVFKGHPLHYLKNYIERNPRLGRRVDTYA